MSQRSPQINRLEEACFYENWPITDLCCGREVNDMSSTKPTLSRQGASLPIRDWPQFPFILPMSGKFRAFITVGTPILVRMSGYLSPVSAVMGVM